MLYLSNIMKKDEFYIVFIAEGYTIYVCKLYKIPISYIKVYISYQYQCISHTRYL